MGMKHVSKLWGKTDGHNQSAHSMNVNMPTHNAGGSGNGRPSIPKSNLAGTATPQFMGSGNAPLKGVGSPNGTAWAKKSQK